MNQTFVIVDLPYVRTPHLPRVARGKRQRAGWPTGLAKIPHHADKGCQYSGGLKCIECPFTKCYRELGVKERRLFIQAFEKDRILKIK